MEKGTHEAGRRLAVVAHFSFCSQVESASAQGASQVLVGRTVKATQLTSLCHKLRVRMLQREQLLW